MEIKRNTITFKSTPSYFTTEKNGSKNNTVRFVEKDEMMSINKFVEIYSPDLIIHIINSETGEDFYRRIRDISMLEDLRINGQIVIFTWDEREFLGNEISPSN